MITLRNLCMYDEALHAYAFGVADLWTRFVIGWHVLWCRECHARVQEHRRLKAVIAAGYGFAETAMARPARSRRLTALVLVATGLLVVLGAMVAANSWSDIQCRLPWTHKSSTCAHANGATNKTSAKASKPTNGPPTARCD
ncbi:MAG: hypothetical protein JSS65_13060 [Armatimonadetes bacterium]|nr:hypothetical protein [Armatimonadota bacterium]